jgi:hypothetical protein
MAHTVSTLLYSLQVFSHAYRVRIYIIKFGSFKLDNLPRTQHNTDCTEWSLRKVIYLAEAEMISTL